ncbi:MAG: ArsI/CadI family heavy metal resistance metalloenzyme [Acidimicrobiales bacterium]
MSRVQLALNVDDLEAAITFYSKLFDTQPAKIREGYANFAIAEPPLKLVLIENKGQGGTLNHLGVEVENTDLVMAATRRLAAEGLATDLEENTSCCYAVQDKVWVHGPDAEPWEVYTVLADAPAMRKITVEAGESACCAPAADAVDAVDAPVVSTTTSCC